MCRYIVECVGMFFIVSVMGGLWNVSVYCGMCRYVFHMEVVGSLWNVSVCCGMCRYVFHRECDGMPLECAGVLWDVSVYCGMFRAAQRGEQHSDGGSTATGAAQ